MHTTHSDINSIMATNNRFDGANYGIKTNDNGGHYQQEVQEHVTRTSNAAMSFHCFG
jgi:hypothetical protein